MGKLWEDSSCCGPDVEADTEGVIVETCDNDWELNIVRKQVVGGTKDIVVFIPVNVGILPLIKLLVMLVMSGLTCLIERIAVASCGVVVRV